MADSPTTDGVDLKPCPFCGSRANTYSMPSFCRVQCTSCAAQVETEPTCGGLTYAKNLWNRRFAPEPSEHPDKARMDWLERQHVEVRTPLVYGSRANFHASPSGYVEDPPNSDLRKRVDACLSATKADAAVSSADLYQRTGSPKCECGHRKAAHDHAGCCGVCGCVVWREQRANGSGKHET